MDLQQIIKDNPNINITISATDLLNFGQEIATNTAQNIINNKEERIYTRSEVKEKFGVCDATIWRWNKLGIINSKKVGNRIYYSENELNRVMNKKERAAS